MPTSLKFGTSGLRGLVSELDGPPAYLYARAFAEMVAAAAAPARAVLVARDLRASGPSIMARCLRAVADAGLVPVDCGEAPTPALALEAQRAGQPAIMVTGSHIPDDRNGLKFYEAKGEIDKADEAAILARLDALAGVAPSLGPPPAAERRDVVAPYLRRIVDFFGARALDGLTVGVHQHSSVSRDLLVDLLGALGAEARPFARSDAFVAVDTEALRAEDVALAREFAGSNRLDAIVSTDGDADRPLVAGADGAFLRGDLVGAITAAFLGADAVVTPVTSNSALEACGRFARVERTRVGSPYVIEGMARAAEAGSRLVVGFEANGGTLLGGDVERDGRRLAALQTRDAALPIVACLAAAARARRPLAELAAAYRFAHALSDRLERVPTERSAAFVARLSDDSAHRERTLAPRGGVASIDRRDGLRMALGRGETLHYRPSGNAPELRVYVEAPTEASARDLLAFGVALARRETM